MGDASRLGQRSGMTPEGRSDLGHDQVEVPADQHLLARIREVREELDEAGPDRVRSAATLAAYPDIPSSHPISKCPLHLEHRIAATLASSRARVRHDGQTA